MATRQFHTPVKAEPWTVRYMRRRPRHEGSDCDGNISPSEKVIRIWSGGTQEARRETLIHEWFHARFPEFEEQAVLELADELNEAITLQLELEGD